MDKVELRNVTGAVITTIGGETKCATGTFVGDGTVILTAAHTIRNAVGPMKLYTGDSNRSLSLAVLECDKATDLALLKVDGYRASRPLHPIFGENVRDATNLVALEYSYTETDLAGNLVLRSERRTGRRTHIAPARGLIAEVPRAAEAAWWLTFPSKSGSSGAALLIRKGRRWGIVGMVFGHDHDSSQALAVDINHLQPFYRNVFNDDLIL